MIFKFQILESIRNLRPCTYELYDNLKEKRNNLIDLYNNIIVAYPNEKNYERVSKNFITSEYMY